MQPSRAETCSQHDYENSGGLMPRAFLVDTLDTSSQQADANITRGRQARAAQAWKISTARSKNRRVNTRKVVFGVSSAM
jgi:hypothetical protein